MCVVRCASLSRAPPGSVPSPAVPTANCRLRKWNLASAATARAHEAASRASTDPRAGGPRASAHPAGHRRQPRPRASCNRVAYLPAPTRKRRLALFLGAESQIAWCRGGTGQAHQVIEEVKSSKTESSSLSSIQRGRLTDRPCPGPGCSVPSELLRSFTLSSQHM